MRYVRGRAREFRCVPSGVRALDRFRPGTPALLAPVREGGSRDRPARRARAAAHGRARGARRRRDPAARPARRGIRPGDRRAPADLPVEPAGPGGRGGADRPGRGTGGARRRVRTADPRRARQDRGGRLAQRREGTRTGDAPGARAGVDVGVPLRWFVFVDLSEKNFSARAGHRVLRYRTEISKARRRAHRAHSVLRKALGDAPITEAVEESTRWLEEFHPRSLVELDYGGLVSLLPDDVLDEDDSPGLVATGLAALSKGDADQATEAYEQLVTRWRAVQLLERCN